MTARGHRRRRNRPRSREPKAKTITFSELKRLSFANSERLPQVINLNGVRKQWVGIGWVDEGELKGDEVLVVEDPEKTT